MPPRSTELDLTSFLQSVQKLSDEVGKTITHSNNVDAKLKYNSDAKIRSEALFNGLTQLLGFRPLEFNNTDSGGVDLTAKIGQCLALITLNGTNMMTGLQILSPEFDNIDTESILAESLKLPSPNDIRHAVTSIDIVQGAVGHIHNHLATCRTRCIVQMGAGHNQYRLCLRSGYKVHIKLHHYYPTIEGGVFIEALYLEGEEEETSVQIALRNELNAQGLRTLMECLDAMDAKFE